MKKEIDNWCVRCTEENKIELGNYIHQFRDSSGWSINNKAYYGIKDNNPYYGSFNQPLKIVLTTEEFYQKIGLIKESKELEIEIW